MIGLNTVEFVFVYNQSEFKDYFSVRRQQVHPNRIDILALLEKKDFDYFFDEYKKTVKFNGDLIILNHAIGLAKLVKNNKEELVYFRAYRIS